MITGVKFSNIFTPLVTGVFIGVICVILAAFPAPLWCRLYWHWCFLFISNCFCFIPFCCIPCSFCGNIYSHVVHNLGVNFVGHLANTVAKLWWCFYFLYIFLKLVVVTILALPYIVYIIYIVFSPVSFSYSGFEFFHSPDFQLFLEHVYSVLLRKHWGYKWVPIIFAIHQAVQLCAKVVDYICNIFWCNLFHGYRLSYFDSDSTVSMLLRCPTYLWRQTKVQQTVEFW